ncbi:oxidoreductase [Rhizocola hellebori]|uniref:Oxidoreductase n=1 Tax=Rhizocola hellebori TaxID=1392758 RepID=A0A8J3QE55_9ACTN|nr:aldo/keto reductase [Rhizocola hellebori]GIH09149.1 oxidoreductase [Rhizocola hellebori]
MRSDEITAAAAGTWTLGDLTVNRMGFGSMRLTANPNRELAITVLRRAVELGVNHIDTAAFYFSPGGILDVGSGQTRYATELIRDALTPYPSDLVITTKVGPGFADDGTFSMASTEAQLRAQVQENLRRLRRDHLDVVNLRIVKRPVPDSIAERFGALVKMRDEGLIRHLGLSNVRVDHLDEAQQIAPVVCVQNGYAIDTNRGDDGLLKICGERGVAFVPFFAIAGPQREAGPAESHSDPVQEIARARGVTPQQVRLAWTLHQGRHVLAIPGTGNPAHLAENIAAGALSLSPTELAQLA